MTMTSLVAVQSPIHPGPNLPGQVNYVEDEDARHQTQDGHCNRQSFPAAFDHNARSKDPVRCRDRSSFPLLTLATRGPYAASRLRSFARDSLRLPSALVHFVNVMHEIDCSSGC